VLLAVLFTIASGISLQAGHAQLQLVALLPLAAIAAVKLVRAEMAHAVRKARVYAALLALVLALWLLSDFYLAWFTLYFVVILIPCWLWLQGPTRWRISRQVLAQHWGTGIFFCICFAVASVPFLAVYLPKLMETGGHRFITSYLVTPVDIANVGRHNYLWGWIFGGLEDGVNTVGTALGLKLKNHWIVGEHVSGFPLILLTLIIVAIRRTLRTKPDDFGPALRLIALAAAVSWIMAIQLGPLSPWRIVYWLVPGAKGLRAVLRYQIWLTLPLLIVAAGVWRHRFMALMRARPVVATVLVAALIFEQLSSDTASAMSRTKQSADFARLEPMPAECPAFYVVNARPYTETYTYFDIALYPHNVDAMFLSSLWGRPTINGFSTFVPPDWDLASPDAPDYDARVAAYARRHGLSVLCRLDARQEPQWQVRRYALTDGASAGADAAGPQASPAAAP
jgi:hypothetical protein